MHLGSRLRGNDGYAAGRTVVHWVPACAGMTVVQREGRLFTWVPACAGMTVVQREGRLFTWVPACAGMTEVQREGRLFTWVPACAGMTEVGDLGAMRRDAPEPCRTPRSTDAARAGGPSSPLAEQLDYPVEDSVAHVVLGHEAKLFHAAFAVDQHDLVRVRLKAAALGRDVVGGYQVEPLGSELGPRVDQYVVRFGGEAHL